MDMEKVYVAILGLGTVGQGVAMMILNNQEIWARRSGSEIILKRTLERRPERKLDVELTGVERSSDWQAIAEDPQISVVIETIGGVEPARTYILEALAAGKNVVTANKELLALYGQEFFAAAKKAGRDLYFEASVAGAVPIISALRQNLSGSILTEVMGIVNGSTNYILTRMEREGVGYGDVLADAQALGYLEADPTADVEGLDAARKAAILATIAFKSEVTFGDVFVEGITKITAEDIAFAEKLDYTIKLVAICREKGGKIEARVHPTLLPMGHPLATVKDSFNAVFVKGEGLDRTMLYGRGAGRMPTASAVMGDVVEIVRNINYHCQGRLNQVWPREKEIIPIREVETRFFLRFLLTDQPGVMAAVSRILGEHAVSLNSVLQKELGDGTAEVVFITHLVRQGNMDAALEEIRELPATREIRTVLRVEGVEI